MQDPTVDKPSRAEQLARHMHNEIAGRPDFDQQDAGYKERAVLAAEGAIAEVLGEAPDGDQGFYVLPAVDPTNGTAYVDLAWGPQRAHLDTEDARLQAMGMLEAAELADVEAGMFRFLVNDGGKPEQAAGIVASFRRFRAAEAEPAETPA